MLGAPPACPPQGDFVRALLDAAQPELDKPARDVSQYTLQVGAQGSSAELDLAIYWPAEMRNARCMADGGLAGVLWR